MVDFGVIRKCDKAVNSKIDQMFWKIKSKEGSAYAQAP